MKTTLYLQNVKCRGCASTISKKLRALDGISNVSLRFDESAVTFHHKTKDQVDKVLVTLNQLGYPVRGEVNNLLYKTKSYFSCAIGRIGKNQTTVG